MTRIVGGAARGKKLAVPAGEETRPTSDRAREGLFNTLESLHGPLGGTRVLDLYAGTGAVGLEALSRGAVIATLVESAPLALATLHRNVAGMKIPGADVVAIPVEQFLQGGRGQRTAYDIVFADPPYALAEDTLADALGDLADWLVPGGIVAIERSSKGPAPRWPSWCEVVKERRYGEATIFYATAGVPQ